MLTEEEETHILYDYADKTVSIFTTKDYVLRYIKERVGEDNILEIEEQMNDGEWSCNILLDFEHCRKPQLITKVV